MSENNPPPIWPPTQKRKNPPQTQNNPFHTAVTPAQRVLPPSPSPSVFTTRESETNVRRDPLASFTNTSKKAKIYWNGWETKPQTPSYKPYAVNSRGHT
jgi:hypothetical protein